MQYKNQLTIPYEIIHFYKPPIMHWTQWSEEKTKIKQLVMNACKAFKTKCNFLWRFAKKKTSQKAVRSPCCLTKARVGANVLHPGILISKTSLFRILHLGRDLISNAVECVTLWCARNPKSAESLQTCHCFASRKFSSKMARRIKIIPSLKLKKLRRNFSYS